MEKRGAVRNLLMLTLVVFTLWLLMAARFPVKCKEGFCEQSERGWAWWER